MHVAVTDDDVYQDVQKNNSNRSHSMVWLDRHQLFIWSINRDIVDCHMRYWQIRKDFNRITVRSKK